LQHQFCYYAILVHIQPNTIVLTFWSSSAQKMNLKFLQSPNPHLHTHQMTNLLMNLTIFTTPTAHPSLTTPQYIFIYLTILTITLTAGMSIRCICNQYNPLAFANPATSPPPLCSCTQINHTNQAQNDQLPPNCTDRSVENSTQRWPNYNPLNRVARRMTGTPIHTPTWPNAQLPSSRPEPRRS
jgi:hypothetical protein